MKAKPLSNYERSLLECTRQGLLFKTWVRPRAATVRNLMAKGLIEKTGDDWRMTTDGIKALEGVR